MRVCEHQGGGQNKCEEGVHGFLISARTAGPLDLVECAAACTQMLPPALSACFVLLLWFGSACAFSLSSATPGSASFFQHRLVEHTDQLQQRRRRHHDDEHDDDDRPAFVPPPHLFCIPAPGGDICLVVDEKGAYHAVRDACPPLGVPLSQTAVVDTQVGNIDRLVDMILLHSCTSFLTKGMVCLFGHQCKRVTLLAGSCVVGSAVKESHVCRHLLFEFETTLDRKNSIHLLFVLYLCICCTAFAGIRRRLPVGCSAVQSN